VSALKLEVGRGAWHRFEMPVVAQSKKEPPGLNSAPGAVEERILA
jgi:hypothetical protein